MALSGTLDGRKQEVFQEFIARQNKVRRFLEAWMKNYSCTRQPADGQRDPSEASGCLVFLRLIFWKA
jgi:hypothetical protein